MSDIAKFVLRRLEGFLREDLGAVGAVPLHEPSFEGNEWIYVKDCLDTGWVSSVGEYVDRIETMLASACGTEHAVAVVNGTSSLHVALLGIGVGAGDAVICPALTFIATANAISYCGATPLFVDSEMKTLGLDAGKLANFLATECERGENGPIHKRSGQRITAIVPMHIFGHPTDMEALLAVAHDYAIPVVEDAAEALGSTYKGKPCGGLSEAGVISLNGNKTITAGGGGAVVTNNAELAARIKHLTTTARSSHGCDFDHDQVGFNYRMPNINAALGCAQLEMLDEYVSRKRTLAIRYEEILSDVNGIIFVREPAFARSNYWLNAVIMSSTADRDAVLKLTNSNGIQTRPCWRLLPDTQAYSSSLCADDLRVARHIVDHLVNLPSGPALAAKA